MCKIFDCKEFLLNEQTIRLERPQKLRIKINNRWRDKWMYVVLHHVQHITCDSQFQNTTQKCRWEKESQGKNKT